MAKTPQRDYRVDDGLMVRLEDPVVAILTYWCDNGLFSCSEGVNDGL